MTPTKPPVIVWFRQDLRLSDNPALTAAAATGAPIIPIYVYDKSERGPWTRGAASRVWLYHSLKSLSQSIENKLNFISGPAQQILLDLVQKTGAKAVYWNRCYDPFSVARDTTIKTVLTNAGATVHSFNASLLFEPWDISKSDGTPYQVFTPFYRKGYAAKGAPPAPLPAPKNLHFYAPQYNHQKLEDILLPHSLNWHLSMMSYWNAGEQAAQKRLDNFLESGINGYKTGRDFPARAQTSRLSPHLHFGEISPRQIWHETQKRLAAGEIPEPDADHFLSELAWREFSYHLLYRTPTLPNTPLQPKFNNFPWRDDPAALTAWQQGQTGYPLVDAGMRELWATGYMHNRVRMIAASFLVKHLLIPWQAGEAWFWDTLVDADLANNAASWQWVAGCGADAAPYFRIFNPVLQGEKFDSNGDYVRRWVPELAPLPARFIHKPWAAPDGILEKAGIIIGLTYPAPIVDHTAARERALRQAKLNIIDYMEAP